MGSQRVKDNLATEQQQKEVRIILKILFFQLTWALFICSFVYQIFLSTFYMSGPVPSLRDPVVNKIDAIPDFKELVFCWRETDK